MLFLYLSYLNIFRSLGPGRKPNGKTLKINKALFATTFLRSPNLSQSEWEGINHEELACLPNSFVLQLLIQFDSAFSLGILLGEVVKQMVDDRVLLQTLQSLARKVALRQFTRNLLQVRLVHSGRPKKDIKHWITTNFVGQTTVAAKQDIKCRQRRTIRVHTKAKLMAKLHCILKF